MKLGLLLRRTLLSLFLGGNFLLRALPPVHNMEVLKESRIVIEGKSNVVDFSCLHTQIQGTGKISESHFLDLQISLPVEIIDCGHKRINKDMRQALKGREFPFVRYQILEACELIPDSYFS